MEPAFRAIGPADLETFLQLLEEMQAFFGQQLTRKSARASAAGLLAHPAFGRAWFIEADGALAGYAVLVLGYSLEFGGVDAFLDELFLRERFRGAGLGKKAMAFVEAEARALGVQALHLEVERDNHPAIELYRRIGYVDHDRYLMTKRF